MNRKLSTSAPAVMETVSTEGLAGDLGAWLERMAMEYGLCLLLAHLDDGVTWGTRAPDGSGRLITPHDVDAALAPQLRSETLQMARLFAPPPAGELLLWRGDGGWRARLLRDARADEAPTFGGFFDEEQILWGTRGRPIAGSPFVEMSDGVQGMRHIVPLPAAAGEHGVNTRPLRLWVRHYVVEADDADPMPGFARVTASRLCDLVVRRSER
jgi:CRISPR-associated protein (TIGR03984 family)